MDVLQDGAGVDIVRGGAGDDGIFAGTGAVDGSSDGDHYDGGADYSTLDYSGLSSGINFVISNGAGTARKIYSVASPLWSDTETTEARDFTIGNDTVSLTPEQI